MPATGVPLVLDTCTFTVPAHSTVLFRQVLLLRYGLSASLGMPSTPLLLVVMNLLGSPWSCTSAHIVLLVVLL